MPDMNYIVVKMRWKDNELDGVTRATVFVYGRASGAGTDNPAGCRPENSYRLEFGIRVMLAPPADCWTTLIRRPASSFRETKRSLK